MPIHFMHKSVSFDELIALYAVSDVCLVSSTRDGMNLVSYEYIATQEKRHGCMILSEFTGAAQSLNGSLIINPWNPEELADAIHDAVTMGDEQRSINYQKLARYALGPLASTTASPTPSSGRCSTTTRARSRSRSRRGRRTGRRIAFLRRPWRRTCRTTIWCGCMITI